MPYPNEHACRLHPPGRYGEWGRTTRRSASVRKQYSVIRGRKKSDGKWEDQAYRYNRNRWSADEARRHCKRHDGRFEAAAPKTQERRQHVRKIGFNIVTLGGSYSVREEQFDGRPHLVVPVVILMEGVHAGTAGARFYPGDEIGKYIDSWNGVPVPVFHPQEYGEYVSANTPQMLDSRSVGRFFNATFDPDGSKLKGELWVDIAKAEEVEPEVLVTFRAGQPMEISTALWWDEDGVAGTWHNEEYQSTVRNYRPDHVALLPGAEGACSVADGCGVRTNQAKGLMDRFKNFVSLLAAKMGIGVETLEMSHEDLRSRVQVAVDGLDSRSWTHIVKAVFDDNVVYEAIALNPSGGAGGASVLYRRGYSVDENEKVTLKDNVEEVRKEVNYVPVANEEGTVNSNRKPESEESKMKKKEELVKALIACDKTKFEEGDREQLMTLSEEMLEKLKAPEVDVEQQEKTNSLAEALIVSDKTNFEEEDREHLVMFPVGILEKLKALTEGGEPEKKPTGTEEPGEKPVALDDFIKSAPVEVQGVLRRSVERDRAVKADLVKALMENDRNEFTKEQLEEKDIEELNRLATLGRVPVDFTGQIGAAAEDPDEIPAALPVFEPAK